MPGSWESLEEGEEGEDYFAYGSVATPTYLLKNEQNILHSMLESIKTTFS